jgi:glycosyltransferase involved in cell wall biosynthesis
LVSKPLRRPYGDGTSVLVRTLVDALPESQRLVYFGDREAPRRSGGGDRVIHREAMGHAPGLASKVSILAEILRPRHRRRGLHFFFTPNTVTSQVLSKLRRVSGSRPIVQSVTSSHGVERHAHLLSGLDAVVVMSRDTQRRLVDAGLDASKVHCIYPAVPEVQEGVQAGARQLLYAGDLDPATAERLIALGHALASSGWKLIIACRPKGEGDAEARLAIESALAAPLAEGRVELHGAVDDFDALRRRCEIQLFMSDHVRRKVDLPLVLLEGLARGQGLISLGFAPLDEIAEVAREEGLEVGKFVDVDASPEEFATAIVGSLDDEQTLQRWRADGPTLVKRRFTPATMAEAHRRLYDSFEA